MAREHAAVTLRKSNAIILGHQPAPRAILVTISTASSDNAAALQQYRDALAQGHFRIQQCRDCGVFTFPPVQCCPHCEADELRWVDPTGKGSVHSLALPLGQDPAAAGTPPLVLIQLEEGPRMPGRVMDVESPELVPGLSVSAHVGMLAGQHAVLFYNKEQGSPEW
jgi:uncharacterized protein